ncbi:hypothetical protein [Rahnella aceris]|uniref:hypothetical protein n=1 Tax=Rahnella sp. (strain Y9602) TaxID=2703885 RepID=UPI000256BD2C|nr:hypothetical protein [Rahnella aceris]AFE58564.1 hypothetical protein Q7S_11685 [Rahnella aquatilis HX2]MBU9859067.1 hypothetical protein [Rahnella aceris]
MSKRSDITNSMIGNVRGKGLVYTKVLGWIDMGHARGTDARKLKEILFKEKGVRYFRELNEWYFPVDYYQEMYAPVHKSSRTNLWAGIHAPLMVRSCLSDNLKKRIALTIMMKTAWRFEAFQDSSLIKWRTDSGFSCEDLVSDLVGFYRVFGEGIDPLILSQPTDIVYSLSIWDHYGPVGRHKNTAFRPLLFPKPSPGKKTMPRLGLLPSWLDYIKPLNDLSSLYLSNRYLNRPVKNMFDDKNKLNGNVYLSLRKGFKKNTELKMPSHYPIFPHHPRSPDYFYIGGDSPMPIW